MSKRNFRKEFTFSDSKDEKSKAAREKIDSIMRKLKRMHPALTEAINYLEPVCVKESTKGVCTDGKKLFFNAEDILKIREENRIYFQIFHIIAHGLLGHFEKGSSYDNLGLAWDIMDLQVINFFNNAGVLPMEYENTDLFLTAFPYVADLFYGEIGFSLYYKALKDSNLQMKIKRKARDCVKTISISGYEDHQTWALPKLKLKVLNINTENADEKGWLTIAIHIAGFDPGKFMGEFPKELENAITRAIRESGIKTWGYGSSNAEGKEVSPDKDSVLDYRDLIKDAISFTEVCSEDDEIDPVIYQYGLELYKDVPLIEPIENKFATNLSSVVIAVDTSGSCIENLKEFWTETTEIFGEIAENGSIEKLHYIECDMSINKEKEYLSARELEEDQEKGNRFMGFGGTSFIPVFERIREYENEGEKIDFLIYFTDGMGDYPEYDPGFKVYYVFPQKRMIEDCDKFRPEWVKTMVLEK